MPIKISIKSSMSAKNMKRRRSESEAFFSVAERMLFVVDRLAKVLAAVMRDQDCKVIIFAQTKKRVDDFFYTIKRLGYPAFGIHGDKRQQERDRVLQGWCIDRTREDRTTDIFFFCFRISRTTSRDSDCDRRGCTWFRYVLGMPVIHLSKLIWYAFLVSFLISLFLLLFCRCVLRPRRACNRVIADLHASSETNPLCILREDCIKGDILVTWRRKHLCSRLC